MIRLYITPDEQQPYLLSFERAHINVGSAEANDVRLQAPGISSRHFRLRSVGAEVVLEDGGSRNGTYVNGVKVTGSQVLGPADVIRIVGFRIKILQPEAGVAATPTTAARPAASAAVPRPAGPVAQRPAAPAAVPRPAAALAPVPAPASAGAAPAVVSRGPARVEPAVAAAVPVVAPAVPFVVSAEPAQEVDPPPGFDAARVAAIVGPRARAFSERADPTQLLRGEELQDAAIWISCGKRVTPAAGVKERMLVARSQQVGQRHGRRRLGIAAAFGLALVAGGWTASSVLAGGPDAHAAGFSRAVVKQFLAAHDAQLRRSCEDSSRQLAEAAMTEAKTSPDTALRTATEGLQCVTVHEGMRDTAVERAVRSLLASTFSHVVERGAAVRVTAADPQGRTFAWGHEDGTVMVWDFARATATARDGAAAVELLAMAGRGDKLIALDASHQVRVWNLLDAEAPPQRFALDRNGPIGKAAASSDGQVLVVADATSTDLRVFPLATPGRVAGLALAGLASAPGALVLGEDGSRVFAASGAEVHGWRVTGGKRAEGPSNYVGHEVNVTALGLATCGEGTTPRWLLSGDAGGGVRLWDLKGKSAKPRPVVLTGVVGGVVALHMTADCRHVIAAGARSLRLWDLKAGEPDRTPRELQTGGPIAGVSLDAGRAVVAAGSKLVVCDLGDGAGACQELVGHSKNVRSVDMAAASGWAITGSDDGSVRLWDTRANTGAASLQAHHPEPVRALALGDEGKVLSAAGADAYLWRLRGAQPPEKLLHLPGQGGRPIKAVALSPNSTWAATAADEASLVLWRLSGERATSTVVATGSRLTRLAFSEDGAWLAGVGPQAACAVAMRGVGQPTCQPLPQAGELSALAFIPGGYTVAVGGTEREVVVIDLDAVARGTGSARQELGKGTGVVRVLAASPDGRWLAAGGEHADGRLWDLKAKGSPAQKLGGLVETVEALAFSPDGRWLAAGAGRKVFAWDLSAFTQPPTHVLEGPAGTVRALAFSSDGALLLSGGADGKLLAWPVNAMAAAPLEIGAQTGMVTQLATLAGGGFAVSAGNDPTLHFWPLTARPLWELAQRVNGPAAPASP